MRQSRRALVSRGERGQALVEYGFLLILVSTVAIAVVILAGAQLKSFFDDVTYELTHVTDATTIGSPTCPDGTPAELRGHKYKCNGHDS